MKMKTKRFSRTLAILLAVMMVFTMMPSMALAAETQPTENTPTDSTPTDSEASVTVQMTATDYASGIEYFLENIEVPAGYAKGISDTYSYGGSISANDVTFLDALAYLHYLQYGGEFINNPTEYLAVSGGSISKAFGNPNANSCVGFINGSIPAQGDTWLMYNEMKLADDNFLEFFIMADGSMGDLYTFLEKDGSKKTQAYVTAGEETGIFVKGGNVYSKLGIGGYGPYNETIITNETGGVVVSKYINHSLGEPEEGITIGADGQLIVSNSVNSGIYEVAVNGADDDGWYCLIPAYIKLYVTNPADAVNANVNVSISKHGDFVDRKDGNKMAAVPVKAYDIDCDGQITINEVLHSAHKEYYVDGEDGYATELGTYGLSLSKLWGVNDNINYNFGYQISRNGNQENVSGLSNVVQEGDHIDAYINESLYPNTEKFTFFSTRDASVMKGNKLTIQLKEAGYDESWATIYEPCEGATITVDGVELEVTTDDQGAATITFDEAGTYILSAKKVATIEGSNVTAITAPVCKVIVSENQEDQTERDIVVSGTKFNKSTYFYNIPDQAYNKSNLSFKVTDASAKEIKASVNGGASIALTSGTAKNLSINAGNNTIVISIVPSKEGQAEETYTYNVKRNVALKTLEVKDANNNTLPLDIKFNTNKFDYKAKATAGTKIKFVSTINGDAKNTTLKINDAKPVDTYDISEGVNVFIIKLLSKDGAATAEYTVEITGVPTVETIITCPTNANLKVTDYNGVALDTPEPTKNVDNTETYVFSSLAQDESYKWTVGKYGYNAVSGTFTAAADETDNFSVELSEAVAPTSSITSEWRNFRNSDSNMAFVSADTPKTAEETKLKWSQKDASGDMSPGTHIIVDGKIVYTSGNKLSLIDKETGKIVNSVKMYAAKGFTGYMPPVYGGGMIYVPLNGGIVQAFDAKTLESCWIYKDELGGQALSPIMYDNGYLYTGFYTKDKYNNFVCISAADEDKTTGAEEKYATWTYKNLGGFYWSGAYIDDNFVVVGGENTNNSDDKALFVFDKKTGKVIDSKEVDGDIRCSIAEKDGFLYFVTANKTTKNGSFYSATLDSNGKINFSSTSPISLGGESTSTPVVVNGYAYVGVNDKTVAQIKISDGTVEKIPTNAYCQSSMLVNTGENEYTYLYFTCNAKPGGIYVIKVNNSTGEMTLDELFEPETSKQQFCIASVMCDENGNLYYYNDSGNLFALEKVAAASTKYELSFKITDVGGTAIEGANIAVSSMDNAAIEITENNGIYTLSPGEYKYEIQKDGYKTASGTVNITNSNMTVPISLQAESTTPGQPIEQTVKIQVIGCDGQANYPEQTLEFREGMTAISVLQAIAGDALEWKNTEYGAYVVGIDGLSEFDKGPQSGWMYKVNGSFPNYSAGEYKLKAGDQVVWVYTTDLGADVGNPFTPVATQQVTTTGASGSAVTTSPTEVAVTGDTAKVTVKAENAAEAIKQAKANKSAEIVLDVAAADMKKATKVAAELPVATVKQIANDTQATLAVKTPQGKAVLDREALSEIVKKAKGANVTIEIAENADKKLEVTVKSAGETIYTSAAEVEKDRLTAEQVKAKVADLKLMARSAQTAKKNVKVTLKFNKAAKATLDEIKAAGYTVKYKFYRSTKKSSKYAATLTKKTTNYTNTIGKKGTMYYYRARVQVFDKDGKMVAQTALKQCKYANRMWSKTK